MARYNLEATSVSADTSSLTRQGQEIAKVDAEFIATHPTLYHQIFNQMDEVIPSSVSKAGQMLGDYLWQLNRIKMSLDHKKYLLPESPLFPSLEDLRKHIPCARLGPEIASQKKYFVEIQHREHNIQTLKDLLEQRENPNSHKVDVLNRIDELFKVCWRNFETLFLVEGIVLRAKIPRAGESYVLCVIMNGPDATRYLIRRHSGPGQHRGSMALFCDASRRIYCPNLYGLCCSVVKGCHICAQMYNRKRRVITHFMLNIDCPQKDLIPCVYIDLKGPCLTKEGKTRYVLCTFNPVTFLKTFDYVRGRTVL